MPIVELLIAFFICILTLSGLVSVSGEVQRAAVNNILFLQAQYHAQKKLDEVKNINRHDFEGNHTSTTNESIYQTAVTEMIIAENVKKITVQVSWNGENNKTKIVTLDSLVSNWVAAMQGNTCNLSGHWNNPRVVTNLEFDALNLPTSLAQKGNLLYMTLNGPRASLPDLIIIDVTDLTQPTVISQLDTGPGLSSIQLNGNYVYVGNTSINAQLQIIDISDTEEPLLIKNYKIPGTYNDNTTVTNALVYSNNYVYLGTQKSEIEEIHIIDVTDPLNPNEKGAYEIGAGINDLAIRGSRLYIASPDDEEFKILDITDPSRIRQPGGINTGGGSGNGKSLALSGNTTYLGRTVGERELYIIDDTDGLSILGTYNPDASITSMAVSSSKLVFAGVAGENNSVQIWDAANPNAIQVSGTLSMAGRVQKIKCGKGIIYAITQSPNNLSIISN